MINKVHFLSVSEVLVKNRCMKHHAINVPWHNNKAEPAIYDPTI